MNFSASSLLTIVLVSGRSLFTMLFVGISPLRERGLKVKERRQRASILLQMALNATFLTLSLLPVYAVIKVMEHGPD